VTFCQINGFGLLVSVLQNQCEDDEYQIDCQVYSLDYRIIDGDVSLPQNSFRTSEFLPHGKSGKIFNPTTVAQSFCMKPMYAEYKHDGTV